MNKVITINLGGTAYQLEEGGYDALRAYLETAPRHGCKAIRTADEILADIEQAIAEKFRSLCWAVTRPWWLQERLPSCWRRWGRLRRTRGKRSRQRRKKAGRIRQGGGKTSGEQRWQTPAALSDSEGAMVSGVCNGHCRLL